MGHEGSRQELHHHRRWMRRNLRGRGRGYGPPVGDPRGRALLRDFLHDNPECAAQLARYAVGRMREDGMTDEEMRDRLDHFQHHGFVGDIDIDDLLGC